MFKLVVSYLYRRFVGNVYIPHNVFQKTPVGDSRQDFENIKGKIIIYKNKKGAFDYLDIIPAEGRTSWEYVKFPFWKFSGIAPKNQKRVHNFAYELEEKQV